jgi:flagellar hook protein FlgE
MSDDGTPLAKNVFERPWAECKKGRYMGIFGALSTAVAGLRAQSFAIENISGNIANSQTIGFKRLETSFVDLIPDAPPSRQLAGTVTAQSRSTNQVQGDLRDSQISTHMAINGAGMFVVDTQSASTDGRPLFSGIDKYTRRGDFALDRNGFLANGAGYYLKGYPVDPLTGNKSGSVPQVIQITSDFQPARTTTQINYRANLAQTPRTGNYAAGTPGSELLYNASASAGYFQSSTAFGATGPFDAVDDAISFNIAVDGGAATPVTINRAAVLAVGNADATIDSPAELTAILANAGVTGVTASLSAGNLRLTSNTTGATSAVAITGYTLTDTNVSGFADVTGMAAGTSTAGAPAGTAPFGNNPTVSGAGFVRADDGNDFVQRSVDGGGLTVYDTLGAPINVQFRWAKTSNTPENWNLFYMENSQATGAQPMWRAVPQDYTFVAGKLSPAVPQVTIPNMTINGSNLGNITLQHGDNGLTQFQDPNGNAQLTALDQDGYSAGQLSSVAVDDGGSVVGTYTNGRSQVLAQVVLATFSGVESLKRLDGGAFSTTQESGVPILSEASNVQGGALESSNTDIADEFTKLIVTQQAYTANTRIVSTSDEMLREALNMIR